MSEHPELDAEDAFEQARQRWTKKGLQASPKARKAREQQLRSTVDGRTLRTTGRTAQFNFKCRPDIKTNAVEAAKEDGLTIAEWLEAAIEAALAKRG